jgi:hypothetical protein
VTAPELRASASPTPAAAQSVSVAIRVPHRVSAASTARRGPTYVSTGTQSASIAVNGGTPVIANLIAGSPNCTTLANGDLSCSLTIDAPVGADTFRETLYAGTDATGAVLSEGTTSATIVPGQANSVALTLDGAIASITLTLAQTIITAGASTSVNLTVNFNDASGASIIGNDPFTTPVILTDSDTSGQTSLSKTRLGSPADAASLVVTYTGTSALTSTIGASAGSITATPVTLSATTFNDYVTFGYDNAHDVFNPNSTAITPASVPNIHLAWQSSLNDFNTQTQPVLATEIPGHAAVLFAGGGSGNVYAYDALTGNQIWTQYLGQMTYASPACGGGTNYFGVGGSVAYDPASRSLYVVGNSNSSLNAYPKLTLFHLDAATGTVLGQVDFAPNAAGPSEIDFSHTSVTLNNGMAYVGTASTCDISSWRGRVAAISVPAMTLVQTFFTLWDPQNTRGAGSQSWGGGGIWGWGGVTLDPSGNVLTGVGNADNGGNGTISYPFAQAPQEFSGYAESLLELSANLATVIADAHPIATNSYGGNSVDLDVQGTPMVFTPSGPGCGTMVALQAKSGTLTLYNENQIDTQYAAQYALSPSNYGDAYLGSPAYSPVTNRVYADVSTSISPTLFSAGLVAIDPGCGNPSVAWHAAFGADSGGSGVPRAVPAVSAGGVVLAGTVYGNGGAVWAIDAQTGTVLNGGNPLLQTNGYLRMPPTIDGDWIYVIDNNGNLYGLTIDPGYATVAAKRRSADSRQRTTWKPVRP